MDNTLLDMRKCFFCYFTASNIINKYPRIKKFTNIDCCFCKDDSKYKNKMIHINSLNDKQVITKIKDDECSFKIE